LLAAKERLLYSLRGLAADSPLEIRYLVDGRELAAEHLDLSRQEEPVPARTSSPLFAEKGEAFDLRSLAAPSRNRAERAVELLALRPDLVRQLAARAREGAAVRIEISHGGARIETVPLAEILERSAALFAGPMVPVRVPSQLQVPQGQGAAWLSTALRPKYLPDCGDCTTSTSCTEECGWDPGKGGPVTCGEYGVCNFTCPCSYTISTTYGSWYNYSAYLSGAAACLKSSTAGRRRHDERVIVERRNVYQNNWVCSGCPSCDGCHTQQTLVGYQERYFVCWQSSITPCASGPTACCSAICAPGGNACNPGC
jgi:hypothetical protein